MSTSKQLPHEKRFIFEIIQKAAIIAGFESDFSINHNLIIAGGAIRDVYFDRNSRDLDVYFNNTLLNTERFVDKLSNISLSDVLQDSTYRTLTIDYKGIKSGIDYDTPQTDTLGASTPIVSTVSKLDLTKLNELQDNKSEYDDGDCDSPLHSVHIFHFILDGQLIEVELMSISMNPIKYIMKYFAIKLSRCYYDGLRLHFTSDFHQDADNKTLTLACPVTDVRFKRLFTFYLPKMKRYFPDFIIQVDLDQMNSTL